MTGFFKKSGMQGLFVIAASVACLSLNGCAGSAPSPSDIGVVPNNGGLGNEVAYKSSSLFGTQSIEGNAVAYSTHGSGPDALAEDFRPYMVSNGEAVKFLGMGSFSVPVKQRGADGSFYTTSFPLFLKVIPNGQGGAWNASVAVRTPQNPEGRVVGCAKKTERGDVVARIEVSPDMWPALLQGGPVSSSGIERTDQTDALEGVSISGEMSRGFVRAGAFGWRLASPAAINKALNTPDVQHSLVEILNRMAESAQMVFDRDANKSGLYSSVRLGTKQSSIDGRSRFRQGNSVLTYVRLGSFFVQGLLSPARDFTIEKGTLTLGSSQFSQTDNRDKFPAPMQVSLKSGAWFDLHEILDKCLENNIRAGLSQKEADMSVQLYGRQLYLALAMQDGYNREESFDPSFLHVAGSSGYHVDKAALSFLGIDPDDTKEQTLAKLQALIKQDIQNIYGASASVSPQQLLKKAEREVAQAPIETGKALFGWLGEKMTAVFRGGKSAKAARQDLARQGAKNSSMLHS